MHEDDWRDSDGQNVFEMFVANGGPGFWIRRITWGGTMARIIRRGSLRSLLLTSAIRRSSWMCTG